jgi:serine protease Do
MLARRRAVALAMVGVLALTAAACGGGGSDDAEVQVESTTDAEGAVSSVDDVQGATIQIVAEGSIRDPEVGYSTNAGAGSGFFVSKDGIAVTNNHVVTGAGKLEVYIGGDDGESYNAEILGVSECNDLAVIKVDVDEDVPFLAWHTDEIKPGLDVYAAGYPLGDPEFTLTRGIVAKAKADGDITGTSSIDYTIEHDANIQPGNSGGALVDESGRVVGVNYAGGAPATNTEQFFAIAAPLAEDVVGELEQGDVESLGVNGWAVYDEAADIAGIWVAGVAAGSPVAEADILPGDIITTLNGVPMGSDGTFADYCDVIRTAGDDPMSVEVLRYDTEEVLRGEINGNEPLELAYSFSREIEEQTGLGAGDAYTRYVTITDDTGSISVDVPVEWSDTDTSPASSDSGQSIPFIQASTDIAEFDASYRVPGMVFAALPVTTSTAEGLAEFAPAAGECTDGGVTDYDDGRFAGQYQTWEECAGVGAAYVVLVSTAADAPGYTFVTVVQATTAADLAVIDQIFATFNLV